MPPILTALEASEGPSPPDVWSSTRAAVPGLLLGAALLVGELSLGDRTLATTITLTSIVAVLMCLVAMEPRAVPIAYSHYQALARFPIPPHVFAVAHSAYVLRSLRWLVSGLLLPPAVAYLVLPQPSFLRGSLFLFAGIIAVLGSICIVFLVDVLLLRYLPPWALRYAPIPRLTILLALVGSAAVPIHARLSGAGATSALDLLPTRWLASWPELASTLSPSKVASATLGLGWIMVMACLTLVAIPHDYWQRLGTLRINSPRQARRRRRLPRQSWTQLMMLLFRRQFWREDALRASVLLWSSYIVFAAIGDMLGGFRRPREVSAGFSGLYFGVILGPQMLMRAVLRSDDHRATWLFRASPVPAQELMLHAKNGLFLLFILPLLVMLGMLHALRLDPVAALIEFTLLVLVAHGMLQVALLRDPALPFSVPPARFLMQSFGLAMVLFASVGSGLLALLVRASQSTPVVFVATVCVLITVSVLVEQRLRRVTIDEVGFS